MCRHLAYLGPPRSLSSLLYEPAESLERQSWKPRFQREGAMNADGWGVGWWDPHVRSDPARYRTASPMWTDRSFRSVAEVVHAGALVAAVRSATPPSPIVATGNEARAIAIEGTSDSEVLFALVLDQLDDGSTPEEALATVTAAAAESQPDVHLNLLLSDGHAIFATTFGNSLFTLQGEGLATGGVLVSSEPLDDHDGWTRVDEQSILRATCTELDISPFASLGGP